MNPRSDNTLVVLSSAGSIASDQALCKFARFAGLETQLITVDDVSQCPQRATDFAASAGCVLALGHATLEHVLKQSWFPSLLAGCEHCFIYGFSRSALTEQNLDWLTESRIASVETTGAGPQVVAIQGDGCFGSLAVAGKSFVEKTDGAGVFVVADHTDGIESLITIADRPHCLRLVRGHTEFFLMAQPELVDLDSTLSRGETLRPWYAQIIAITGFLRHAFGDACWAAPVTGATLIVDDPDLNRRYGFVDYRAFVAALDRIGGALTVAFIPYNHKRADRATVEQLSRRSDRFSIAIHGCDHTRGEYASGGERWLACITRFAQKRMAALSLETGMSFDNIMIFPQGIFSTDAIRALKKSRVVAAVNTDAWPVDSSENPLTIGDLMAVAVTRFEKYPLFLRRYPRDFFDYAFDLMLQKPILMVEHHEYFRDGYAGFAKLVESVSSLGAKVCWMPLGRTIAASYVIRKIPGGRLQVRHFAPELCFRNPNTERVVVEFEKPELEGEVESIHIRGLSVPFEIDAGCLRYEISLEPKEEINVAICYRQVVHVACTTRCHDGCIGPAPNERPVENSIPVWRPTWKYRSVVAVRRLLCDVRDNYLARNERVLAAVKALSRMVRASSGKP